MVEFSSLAIQNKSKAFINACAWVHSLVKISGGCPFNPLSSLIFWVINCVAWVAVACSLLVPVLALSIVGFTRIAPSLVPNGKVVGK